MRQWEDADLEKLAEEKLTPLQRAKLYDTTRNNHAPKMVITWTDRLWPSAKLLARITECRRPHLILMHDLRIMETRRQLEGDNCEKPFQVEELLNSSTERAQRFLADMRANNRRAARNHHCHQRPNGFRCYCDEEDGSSL